MMKKQYLVPQTEVVELRTNVQLLAGSPLPKSDDTTSEQWSRELDDFLME